MKKTLSRIAKGLIASAAIGIASTAAAAPIERSMCAFDPIGANGPLFEALKEYQIAAINWGVKLELKPYTDERVAAEDFKAGVCDLVNVSGLRSRTFNSFTGTLDSIGAMPTYDHLKTVLATLSSPKAAKYMSVGEYEIVSIVPAGAIYAFVADRSIDDVEDLAGKRITVLDNAPEMHMFVAQAGLTPVSATLANVFSKFNNHTVDITGAPAVVFEPMELYKGLEPNGGIIEFPLLQVTLQVISRKAKLPEGFGQQSREYANGSFEEALKIIKQSEDRIPEKYWIRIPDEKKTGWYEIMRQNRIALRDKGIYNSKALTLFRKIRCSKEPARAECSAEDKE